MAAIREKAKKFQKFVKGLEGKYAQALPDPKLPLLDNFVFYLLLYSNPVTHAKKAFRALRDEKRFAGWMEVRVATPREIAEVLEENKISHAQFLAPRLKQFLQKVFEEVDAVAFEPLLERIQEAEDAKKRRDRTSKAKEWINGLPGIPPWGPTYLLTGLGFERALPWDPHTEAVLEAQKVFPPKATLAQKKRVAKALLEGLDGLDPLQVHHLLVEYAKRDLKRR
ncbi:MAG: hypothetical protein D6731_12420 [Planctomycetota bacterium]|nr:MAG: hypothetical protein D6731_12420 [Planctomycetota bacterium]